MNPTVSDGLIPAKVFVMERASVTAGLANDVEAVNQMRPRCTVPRQRARRRDDFEHIPR